MRTRRLMTLFGAQEQAYYEKVRAIAGAALIGMWRLNETAGAVAADSSGQANNGQYVGVDLANAAGPDGVLCPWFDKTNDSVNIYSAGFAADWSGAAFTFSLWFRVDAAAVWTDGVERRMATIAVNGNNQIRIAKSLAANRIDTIYVAGGTAAQVFHPYSAATWTHAAVTVDKAADEMKVFVNGVQVGATQNTLGVWAGALAANSACIGSSQVVPVGAVFHGWLSNAIACNAALTPAQILAIATI